PPWPTPLAGEAAGTIATGAHLVALLWKQIGFLSARIELASGYDDRSEGGPSGAAAGGCGLAHLPQRRRHRHRRAVQGGRSVEALDVPAVREQGRTAGGEPGAARGRV